MPRTQRVKVSVKPDLIMLAGSALGMPDAGVSDVVRTALAKVAGVDVSDHTPRRTGRPPRKVQA